jgi:hypothetical protein
MEWIIHIEGKKDRRILIQFDPLRESIYFVAQYKPTAKNLVTPDFKGFAWVNVAEDLHSMNIEFTEIQAIITKIYDQMEARLKVEEDLAKVFSVFKTIEVKED